MLKYSTDSDRKVTTFTAESGTNTDEMLAAIESFYRDGPTPHVIMNLLDAGSPSVSMHDVDKLVDLIKKYSDLRPWGKTIIVVPHDYAFGMARMHSAKAQYRQINIEYHIVRTMEEAYLLLGIENQIK